MDDQMVGGAEQAPVEGIGAGAGTGGGGDVPTTPAAGGAVPSSGASGLSPEQLYDVKVNGKTLKVGLQELLNGYSRHSYLTQRSQEMAAKEKEWTSRLGNYEKAIQETRALLSDRQRLAQILQQLPGQEDDGDTILTKAEVEQMRKSWFEEFRNQQLQEQQAQQYQHQVESLKHNFLGELKGVYDSMAEQFPMLKKLPLFNELRLKVGTYEPQSIADAKALLANEIQELAKDNGWTVGAPGAGMPMGRPTVPGIEPPGGGGLMPESGQNFSSVRDPRLKNAVLADIEQLMRASLNS